MVTSKPNHDAWFSLISTFLLFKSGSKFPLEVSHRTVFFFKTSTSIENYEFFSSKDLTMIQLSYSHEWKSNSIQKLNLPEYCIFFILSNVLLLFFLGKNYIYMFYIRRWIRVFFGARASFLPLVLVFCSLNSTMRDRLIITLEQIPYLKKIPNLITSRLINERISRYLLIYSHRFVWLGAEFFINIEFERTVEGFEYFAR